MTTKIKNAGSAPARAERQNDHRLPQGDLLYEAAFEHADGPKLICDRDGRVLRANRRATALLGHAAATASTLTALFAPVPAGSRLTTALRRALQRGGAEVECLLRHAASHRREALLAIAALDADHLLINIRDVAAMRAMERDLQAAHATCERLSAYDPLTGLPNRESLRDTLQQLMDDLPHTRRGELLAGACLRPNSIRSINEKYGHAGGDALIRDFSVLLAQHQRENFQIFRLRGVVFVIVITGCKTEEQVTAALESFVGELPALHRWGEQSIDLNIAVGLAFTRDQTISTSDLIHRGERALDDARKHTKGSLVLFNEESVREIHREIDISLALSHALARNEFHLAYQPKVDHSIRGLEALIRWHSSELGNVSPAEFIPLAEELGKIQMISEFVIEEVCRQLASWHASFGTVWPVAINLSGLDLQRNDLASFIQKTLQRHRVQPAWLHLEITETGLIENDEVARRNLDRLIALGLRIAIDDFGTGYSSLKKLSEYPIHAIKIDRSFVMAIGKNPRSDRIIQLIVMLARVLDCEVVAEGVETPHQLQFLLDNDCTRFQGYLFHKPLSTDEIEALIAG